MGFTQTKEAPTKVCSVDGCSDSVHAKGWCTFHYNSARNNNGDPLAAERSGKRKRSKAKRKQETPNEEKLFTPDEERELDLQIDEQPETLEHPAFGEVCELIEARENVMLVGPAGTGKTYLAEQSANHFGLRFRATSCSAGMSESVLVGRSLPKGDHGQFEFCGTDFLDCFENGGVFLLDEMDSADPNVLLVINSALANGRVSVPARTEKPFALRHPDFVLIAACNTFGRGADRQYVGRSQLDESTLDRFRIGTIEVDYSETLETKLFTDIAGDSDQAMAILAKIWKYRAGGS